MFMIWKVRWWINPCYRIHRHSLRICFRKVQLILFGTRFGFWTLMIQLSLRSRPRSAEEINHKLTGTYRRSRTKYHWQAYGRKTNHEHLFGQNLLVKCRLEFNQSTWKIKEHKAFKNNSRFFFCGTTIYINFAAAEQTNEKIQTILFSGRFKRILKYLYKRFQIEVFSELKNSKRRIPFIAHKPWVIL